MDLDCTCFRVRRLSRQITNIYDEALRPTGLKVTQFSLLSALRNFGPLSVAALAKIIHTDTTSMSRALRPVMEAGWVSVQAGSDRRSKLVALTRKGRQTLASAVPHWQEAQGRISDLLGRSEKKTLDRQLDELAQRIAGG